MGHKFIMKYIFILTLTALLASCMTDKEIQENCIEKKRSLSACLSTRSGHFHERCSGWYVCSGMARVRETPEEFAKRCECKNDLSIFILRRI